jgi:hypothetical protein
LPAFSVMPAPDERMYSGYFYHIPGLAEDGLAI